MIEAEGTESKVKRRGTVMEDYRMGLRCQGKTIWVNICCFCAKAQITNQCECTLGQTASDECAQYERCANVPDRVYMLLGQLPENYGKPESP